MAIDITFIEQLKSGLQNLPGREAHHKMSMVRLKDEPAEVLERARKSAVMLVIYPKFNEPHSVLIQRPAYNGVHSRQIALPGGQHDPEDPDFEATAHRETFEEIGVQNVHVIGQLTQVYIKPSDFLVYPYVGVLQHTPTFTLQEDEVDDVIEFPIRQLLDEGIVETAPVETKLYGTLHVPSFNIGGKTVWGATGAMLNEFKEILKTF